MAGPALCPGLSNWLVLLLLLLSAGEPVLVAKTEELYRDPKGFSTLAQLKRRNTLKDGIIMIQTLLIILFIIVPIFLLLDKDDSKAGMEEDHTYEGLDIDQTATYEDIVTLRTGEVKWSVGEHPGQE
ncbi:B-cell antigen receptor complex-associated protein beta chain isoform X3 [Eschrichtius robustus]|uniref:B-cell antigen receptor complex-associated protein beta chain isoform X3 n=1 Tax=Eschrichtius robustus TaxID=9764 RepID=UPI0035C1A765